MDQMRVLHYGKPPLLVVLLSKSRFTLPGFSSTKYHFRDTQPEISRTYPLYSKLSSQFDAFDKGR